MTIQLMPSPQYEITLRLEYPHESGWIARISSIIADQGATIHAIDLVEIRGKKSIRDYSVECSSSEHAERIVAAIKGLDDVRVHSVSDKTFLIHLGGKLEVRSKVALKTRADLSMAYTPGVARVCKAVHHNYQASFNLTIRKNTVAVVSDGSAVLGLGNIGPAAAMPVMEGKAVLFKEFGGVDAFPLCVDTQDQEQIIDLCRWIAPTFGAINLEDISAPRCFRIEEALADLDIPVFHDDQHGTAVVALAGFINAVKIVDKDPSQMKAVVAGAGAAGVACTKALLGYGLGNVVVCDSKGAIGGHRSFDGNPTKEWLAEHTNVGREKGSLKTVIRGADMFLGVSAPNILTRDDVAKMAEDRIVFAMSNPDPEVAPEAIQDIVAVLATGRSDYPNQVNNVLAFPGIFRGALDSRADSINEEMKLAAAEAIAGTISEEELSPDYVIPSVFNRSVAKRVATAVARAAHHTHVGHRRPKGTSIYQV